MKISNSKKQLAKIINENGGWLAGGFAAQQDDGEVWFSTAKPFWEKGRGVFCMPYEGHFTIGHLISNRHQTILSRDEYFHLHPAPDADGWIEWRGGECPVDEGVVIDVKFRNGTAQTACAARCDKSPNHRYWTWIWSHSGHESDIIAYRLHNPEHSEQEYPDGIKPIDHAKQETTIEQLAADYRDSKDYAERKRKEANDAKADAEAKLKVLELAGEALGLIVSPITAKQEPELVITDWRDLKVGDEIKVFNFECPEDSAARKKELSGGVCVVMSARGGVVNIERKDNLPKDGPYWNATGVDACNFTFIRRP